MTLATSQSASSIVGRVWNYASVLRDDGLSYADYLEQLTYLLFLKMNDERASLPGQTRRIPAGDDWDSFRKLDGDALQQQYQSVLENLSKAGGMLGTIFAKAENRIKTPSLLKRLVSLIDAQEWLALDADVTGDVYESLLERNAEDVKGGAGQYFTPRALIRAIVQCVRPKVGEKVCDPASGTGGFLLAAHEFMKHSRLDRDQARALSLETFYGTDIVGSVVRLATMNLWLHNIGGDAEPPIAARDALQAHGGKYYEVVLANPPFGKKSSFSGVSDDGKVTRETLSYERNDFWATTGNKQLLFLMHIASILAIDGRAAVVLPDNVLFEGGAGETIRRRLLQQYDLHTILRLPTGIFYAGGVKANVLFFDRKPAQEGWWTQGTWVYDLRTNQNFTMKTNPLRLSHLEDFIQCYATDDRSQRTQSERFKRYSLEELLARDKVNLDITWLQDNTLEDAASLPAPDVLALEITEQLRFALEQFAAIGDELSEA